MNRWFENELANLWVIAEKRERQVIEQQLKMRSNSVYLNHGIMGQSKSNLSVSKSVFVTDKGSYADELPKVAI